MAKGERFSYYVCGTLLKKGAGCCETRYLSSWKFEGLVINKIKEHILIEESLQKLVHLVNEEMDSTAAQRAAMLIDDYQRRVGYQAYNFANLEDKAQLMTQIVQEPSPLTRK